MKEIILKSNQMSALRNTIVRKHVCSNVNFYFFETWCLMHLDWKFLIYFSISPIADIIEIFKFVLSFVISSTVFESTNGLQRSWIYFQNHLINLHSMNKLQSWSDTEFHHLISHVDALIFTNLKLTIAKPNQSQVF